MALNPLDVVRVFNALSPQARTILDILAKAQKRSPEEVLRDEIRTYVAGNVPQVDIDSAMRSLQSGAYQAGWFVGRLRRLVSSD